MRMTISLLCLALGGVSYAGEAVTVEKAAVDIPGVVAQAKQDAKAMPAGTFQVASVTGMWTDTDCKTFDFAENSPAQSQPQYLRSETWIEECDNVPLPYPPGGGICIPRRRLLRADFRNVTVRVEGRQVPGPKESFQVCLWASQLTLKVKQSPNKYDVQQQDDPVFNTTYVLKKK